MTVPDSSPARYDLRDHKGRYVSTKGLSSAARRIAEVGARTRDLRPAWPAVGAYMSRLAREQFDSHGARLGTGWAPLQPDYLRWKIKQPNKVDGGLRTLVLTGALRDSYTRRPMSVEDYGRKEATFGSDDPKAHWHQYGTRNMPARPVLVRTPEVDSTVADILGHYIATGRIRRR